MLFVYIFILFQLDRAKSIEKVMIDIITAGRFTVTWSDEGEGIETKKP